MKSLLEDTRNYTAELFSKLDELDISREKKGEIFEAALNSAREDNEEGLNELFKLVKDEELVRKALQEQLELEVLKEDLFKFYHNAKDIIAETK